MSDFPHVARMEPEATGFMSDAENAAVSIAISLKRIADAIERRPECGWSDLANDIGEAFANYNPNRS